MSIYKLKSQFQNLLRPITRGLARIGVTANQVTVLAMLLSCAVGFVMYMRPSLGLMILPIFLFVRMALNAIDGMLAREHNMQSKLGAILNEMGDVVSDTALYLPFIWVSGFSSFTIITIVILAVMSEMMGVVAVQIGASRRYDGPMGKSDRAFVFGLLAILVFFELLPQNWIFGILIVIVLLLVWTIFNRAYYALKECK
ncbi:CDP-alcohol phosphatidyltransferase family protein [Candidatus Uabimicrobium amorphum]|uniref:Membrane protein n=1 Tax=Uabimicrobium amorphum TaxID=2596890 RepID=A0A5S9F1X7_UABAM|nr:CDP-alcohol phosphatidyltransferase family protein [Candidatus Uabimicrobium amorphum]BBM83075.1 membrane protein [Candidatus Uabimicrobium amorphum]